ncbi:MAG: hypothetical protein FJZ01_22825 [Candidatus Sericytochromatia bacterium]|nr:hypothetical protein [Candidatus Tanganyikabacteria bacterium]
MRKFGTRFGIIAAALAVAGCGTSGQLASRATGANTAGSGSDLATASRAWLRYPDAPTARFAAAGAASGFRLLVLGGYDDALGRLGNVEQFTAFDKWETLPALPTRRSSAAAATVPSERILVFGGAVPGGVATQPLGSVERLSLATRKWDRLADMPTPRWGAAAAAKGLFVYVAGGSSWGHAVDAFELYNAIDNTWKALPALPQAREFAAIGALGERVVVAGGAVGGVPSNDTHVYNPEAGTWTKVAPMPTPRTQAAYAVYGHVLYVVGGIGPGGKSTAVESFHLGTGAWTRHTPLPEPLSGAVAARLGERLVVTGGSGADGRASARTYGLPFSL